MPERTLVLTSPHMRGPDVKSAKQLLAGKGSKYGNFHPGDLDNIYDEEAAAATYRAKWALGYPKAELDRKFGPVLRNYLDGTRRLSAEYAARRKARLEATSVKAKALALALADAQNGVTENPAGSNLQKYGAWYGFNGVPWCAEAVSYWLAHAGDKNGIKTALAYQFEYWARSHEHGLSVTSNPEPGDIVVYHHGDGHTGLFKRWKNRSAGEFEAVEGNTSAAGSQDNGGAVLVKARDTGWVNTVFVHVP